MVMSPTRIGIRGTGTSARRESAPVMVREGLGAFAIPGNPPRLSGQCCADGPESRVNCAPPLGRLSLKKAARIFVVRSDRAEDAHESGDYGPDIPVLDEKHLRSPM